MDKSLKIVLIPIATYIVLGLQFFIEKGVLIIPYMLNPIVLLITSLAIVFNSYKKENFIINLVYFLSILFYCFTSERTLNMIYNYSEVNFFIDIIQNPFLRLFSILSFLLGVFYVMITYLPNKYSLIPFILLILSTIFGLIGVDILYVITFTLFAIIFLGSILYNIKESQYLKYNAVAYQLVLFSFLEGLFFLMM